MIKKRKQEIMTGSYLQSNFAERIGGSMFGKDTTIYKFEKIKDILIKDPDYIEYILESVDLDPDVKYSIEHHLANLDQEPEYRFSIGKYKGMLVNDVAEIDMQYLSWAYHNMKMSKGMRRKIGEILQKGLI